MIDYEKFHIVLLFCFGLAIVFNVLILIIAKLYVDFKEHLEAYFVISITKSDFLYAVLMFITEFEINWKEITRSKYCYIYWIFYYCLSVASFTFIFLLALYKFILLYFPFKAIIFWSKNKIMVVIVVSWLFLFCISITFVEVMLKSESITNYTNNYSQCQYLEYSESTFYFEIFGFILSPLVLSFVVHILIFIIAQKKKHKSNSICTEWRNLIARLFLVFASIIWTMSIVLPPRVMYVVRYEKWKTTFEDDEEDEFINMWLWVWFAVGSMINPFVTLFTRYEYRNGVKKLWSKLVKSYKNQEYCFRIRIFEAKIFSTRKNAPAMKMTDLNLSSSPV